MKHILILVFIFPACLLPLTQNELKFKELSVKEGLSHNKINCILEDENGFLWFGTNDGLCRYDAYEFKVFQRTGLEENEISANLIRCILQDQSNNIWIGTDGGGLNHFDKQKETFTVFSPDSDPERQLSSYAVTSLVMDQKHNLWIGTSQGLDRMNLETKKTDKNISLFEHQENGLYISKVFLDRSNTLWVGTEQKGLYKYDPESGEFHCFEHHPNDPHSISDNDIRAFYQDTNDNLWIGTYNGGLNLFDSEENKFYSYSPEHSIRASLTIRAICEDNTGHLWLGTRNGLYIFDPSSKSFSHIFNDPQNLNSLSNNNVLTILKDQSNNFWIGTRSGVNYLNMNATAFKNYLAHMNDTRYLNDAVVNAIYDDPEGDVWVGTETGGLNRLDKETGRFKYYQYDPYNTKGISSNNIKSITKDKQGNIWIGTFQGGVNVLDVKSETFTHFRHNPKDPNTISDDNINKILIDTQGNIWLSTYDGDINLYDKTKNRFIRIMNQDPDIDTDVTGTNPLYEDSDGTLWLGGANNKIYWLNKKTFHLNPIEINAYQKRITISSIIEDRDKNLWIGTHGNGIYKFNKSDSTFENFTQKNGLPSNIVCGILRDDKGNLWISTQNGLSKFFPSSKMMINYFEENGLSNNQFNLRAYSQSETGILYFGNMNGVVSFQPGEIKQNIKTPPVALTQFRVFNKKISHIDSEYLSEPIEYARNITLSYKESVFSFSFAALNFVNPEQNQYAYILRGFEQDWNYVGNQRIATYTNLDPGKYTFIVKGSNNDGVWNEKGAFVNIEITPPFWQTIWFKGIMLVFIIMVFVHYHNFFSQKRKALRAMAYANLSNLQLLRNQMNPHFLFNTLGSIRSMLLIDPQQAWQMISELSDFFRYSLTNFSKFEASLEEEIEAVQNYLAIEKVRFRDSLSVDFNVEENAKKCQVPAFIFQPLVENAIKYGMRTSEMPLKVVISVSFTEHTLFIDVSNTGKLLTMQKHPVSEKDIHGNAIDNIKKRLDIFFGKEYDFQLYEQDGWVHARIKLIYKDKRNKNSLKHYKSIIENEMLQEYTHSAVQKK
ncbi:hypothetical protein GF406_00470 [candidate division KSB1 bacterium]|nr:hypothetical protein [candidate division KSB1 bacterium]